MDIERPVNHAVAAGRIRISGSLPGPRAAQVIARDEQVSSGALTRVYPLVPERAEGCWITDVDGNTFLDLFAGIAVCATGHCHPDVVRAVEDQLRRAIHVGGADVYSPLYMELCEKLVSLAPPGPYTDGWEVFLTNSGTESVEGAVKLARYHTRRQGVIAFRGGFHGRSMGALSLTASKAVQRQGFGPLLSGVTHLKFPECDHRPGQEDEYSWGYEAARRQLVEVFESLAPPEEIAAIVAEPIQGEGGYVIPPDGFFQAIRALCDEYGILFIADEVQTGFGRTGRTFAIEHWQVQPDIICMAKGISSGVPVGAFMSRKRVSSWPQSAHGSTWGGSPLGCAAALANIQVIQRDDLMQNAVAQGAFLADQFRQLMESSSLLQAVRQKGLMLGLDLPDRATAHEWMTRCFQRGVLVLTAGKRSVRLSPPLTISRAEAETGFCMMQDVLLAMEGERRSGSEIAAES